MVNPPTTRALSTGVTLDATVRAEIEALRASGQLGTGYRTQPRCYVCCEAESKDLVNKLLAAGLTNREIAEACGYINARREEKGDDRMIIARGVWVHRKEHFNLDKPAQEAYRAIFERRAREADRDFEEGTGTAVTPLAVFEVAMAKGYGNITDEATTVTVKEALEAATKLHDITHRDAGQRKMADLLFTMDKIITAAQEFIPPDRREAFLARVRGDGPPPDKPMAALAEHVREIAQEAIREFTPSAKIGEDDEI